jgi:hypothetical protein
MLDLLQFHRFVLAIRIPQLPYCRYPVQVNFLASDVLSIYGFAVTRPLEVQRSSSQPFYGATAGLCEVPSSRIVGAERMARRFAWPPALMRRPFSPQWGRVTNRRSGHARSATGEFRALVTLKVAIGLSSSWDFQDSSFVLDDNHTALDDNLPFDSRNPEQHVIFPGRDLHFK